MTMQVRDERRRRLPSLHFLVIAWVVGAIVCTIAVTFLKIYGVYPRASWLRVMMLPVFVFVGFPVFVCGGLFFLLKLFSHLERWTDARRAREDGVQGRYT